MNKRQIILAALGVILLIVSGISTTMLYIIDAQKETNRIVIGYNEIDIKEEFDPPPELKQGDNIYKKAVSIKNTGNTEAYVRVFADFSSKEIADISQISNDNGETYSSLSSFTPSNGWVHGNDTYYYYTTPLAPGESTSALFTNVKTTFENADEIQQYELIVYAESVQTKDLNGENAEEFDYAAAWAQFLNRKT